MTQISQNETKNSPKMYGKFTYIKEEAIDDISCTLRELQHPCGAKVLHLENDDDENVFCLSFQTLPESDDGAAHILEHTVLCGSKKFPVKDPFFSMNRRSLNTFMNALTGADFTCYPAASQIPKDFYNLLEVYLDSVFQPILSPLSFSQEGHRLEMGEQGLMRSGIVYNEMKGAFTCPESRLWKALQRELFANTPYAFESGGDPVSIPTLNHEKLCDFHQKFYHPSRCLFFFYGNLPLQQHLDFLEKHTLSNVQNLPTSFTSPSALKAQKRFSKPRRIQCSYPVLKEEKEQGILAFSWLTCSIKEQEKALALEVLDHLLTGTDASILRQELLKSGLCKQVDSFIEEEFYEIPFVFIVKGCEAEDAEKIEIVIFDCLKKLSKDGLSQEKIEAAIHQIEMQRREISSDHYPLGLNFFMRAALLMQHGGEGEKALQINEVFKTLRKNFAQESYLKKLVQETFLDNMHYVRVDMQGDPKLAEEEEKLEKQELKKIAETLSKTDIETIKEENQKLLQVQEEKEDLSVLPKLSLGDVPLQGKDFPLQKETLSSLNVYSHHCFCNQVIYTDLVFSLPLIPEEDLRYLKLFSYLIPQLGAGGRNYKSTLDWMQSNTGGIGMQLSMHKTRKNDFQMYLSLGGKALRRKSQALFELLKDYLSQIDLKDTQRIRELIEKHFVLLHNNLSKSALKYASKLALSSFCLSSHVQNQWSGLPYYYLIRDLAQNFSAKDLVEKLQLFCKLLEKSPADLIVACDEKSYEDMEQEKFFGLNELIKGDQKNSTLDYTLGKNCWQGREISSSVAFNCLAMPGKSYFDPQCPALCLASTIFENQTLHKKIREQGGAYGSAAVNQPMSGNFYFYSYRDPQIADTLQAFSQAVETVCEDAIEEDAIEEAKLGILQGLDHPVCPSSRAISSYFWEKEGKDFTQRQIFRRKVLETTKEEIRQAAQFLLSQFDNSCFVSFAGKEILEKENKKFKKQEKQTLKILEI